MLSQSWVNRTTNKALSAVSIYSIFSHLPLAPKPKVKTFLLKLSDQNKRAFLQKREQRGKEAFQSCWFRLCFTKMLHGKEGRQAGRHYGHWALALCGQGKRAGVQLTVICLLCSISTNSKSISEIWEGNISYCNHQGFKKWRWGTGWSNCWCLIKWSSIWKRGKVEVWFTSHS